MRGIGYFSPNLQICNTNFRGFVIHPYQMGVIMGEW
jgi:hypothetical protein